MKLVSQANRYADELLPADQGGATPTDHNVVEIEAALANLAAADLTLAERIVLPETSFEGRTISCLRLGSGSPTRWTGRCSSSASMPASGSAGSGLGVRSGRAQRLRDQFGARLRRQELDRGEVRQVLERSTCSCWRA